ncbi:hypothetical protein AXG93_1024s1160 [Marchantia polymorpha subsp. ruderalis]|uniref:Uncharacterized protein n=1 Tax=Marchantia polymorpha subsp. ruderalis TaxID=1480154 RepID=A0A176VN47_MARPO|nr:hypothetical protein AXG93_1024s1160 [Marchantia polymorpha subsp. ruderalis]
MEEISGEVRYLAVEEYLDVDLKDLFSCCNFTTWITGLIDFCDMSEISSDINKICTPPRSLRVVLDPAFDLSRTDVFGIAAPKELWTEYLNACHMTARSTFSVVRNNTINLVEASARTELGIGH